MVRFEKEQVGKKYSNTTTVKNSKNLDNESLIIINCQCVFSFKTVFYLLFKKILLIFLLKNIWNNVSVWFGLVH